MSELSPSEIQELARRNAERALRSDILTDSAIAAIDILPTTVSVDPEQRSERYPYPKWRISEPITIDNWQQRKYGIAGGDYRIGYPIIKGQKRPDAVHIIYNDNFGLPWATALGDIWEQQIEGLMDDAPLSEHGQRVANIILEKVTKAAGEARAELQTRRRKIVSGAIAATAIVAAVAGGLAWNDARIDRNNAKAAAVAAARASFDQAWANRTLTETPIPTDGQMHNATEGPLPTDIPTLKISYNRDQRTYSLSEPITPGLVRGLDLWEGCYDLPVELGESDTVSVVAPPNIDNVAVGLRPDENEVKICVNPFNGGLGRPMPVAIQVTPRS